MEFLFGELRHYYMSKITNMSSMACNRRRLNSGKMKFIPELRRNAQSAETAIF